MRQIVIGDIHGRNTWKYIALNEKWDMIIFLGDYFDSRDGISIGDQQKNFDDILKFKELNTDKVKLLFGNHDYHYLPHVQEHYSGFNPTQKYIIAERLNNAVASGELQLVHIQDNVYFSHAGISRHFIRKKEIDINNLEEDLNRVLKCHPEVLGFCKDDPSSIGDHVDQSPIWIRPRSLLRSPPLVNMIQVIGHTQTKHVTFNMNTMNPVIQVDALGAGEYLIIEDEAYSVGFIKDLITG